MRKYFLRIGVSTIIVIAVLCVTIIFVLNSPSEDNSQTTESMITLENISAQTQNNTPYIEFQEELASTKELITVPIGGFHTNFIRLKPGET